MLATGKPIRLASVFVAVTLFIVCSPTEAWYKQAAGPSYYSVGRASGLLSGIRRSPYIRRSEPERESALESAETLENDVDSGLGSRINLILKNTGVCVKRLSPDMQSCERVDGGASVYRCKADVFLLLHSQDCLND